MSRYFDLMQQAGIDDRAFVGNGTSRPVSDVKEREVHQSQSSFQSSSLNDETLDLVQRIFLVPENPPRVVVFAGVDEQCDISQICSSAAETLARISKRPVCLVEANFRSPNLPGIFGVTNRHGLVDALAGTEAISGFCKPLQENLWLLSAGTLDANSPSLLTPENLKDRFTELRDDFEFIIVDAPPLARYAETMILGRIADGLALVLEAGSTRREAATAATANLRASNIPILAAVLNKAPSQASKKFFS
ncbi:MAG TPA: CpsD/CapB family tyrosine-protein kinase [Silvibacterium sp.]|jgi:Mrp family chromosome partitioning ATPase|nr:CpsD/CapB family tyrosine-protein kinase [Silvibacterium sp.]